MTLALLAWLAGPTVAAELIVTVLDPQHHGVPAYPVIAEPAAAEHSRPTRHAVMDQRDLQFVPDILVVQTGTLVDFPNSDQILHQVYSFSPAKSFQLSLYAGRAHPPVLFDRPGIVTVGCNIHDSMIGYIYVTDSPYFGQTDASGRLELKQLPPGAYTVKAWHPRAAESDLMLEQYVTLAAAQPATLTFQLSQPLRPAMAHMTHRKDKWEDY